MRLRPWIPFIQAVLCFGTRTAVAAPGDLDPTFSHAGILNTAFGFETNRNHAVAAQADGKLVVGGDSHLGDFRVFTLIRYNPDGSLDPSFGGDGVVQTSFGSGYSRIRDLAIQSDGKIVAAGDANDAFAVARYLPDGSLDASWDADGKALFALAGEFRAFAMVLQGAKIVVAGEYSAPSSDPSFAIARFNSNGSHDTSFDGDGLAITDFGDHSRALGVWIQQDGKILAVGDADPGTHLAMARYLDTGALDPSLDADGKMIDTRPSIGFAAVTVTNQFPALSRIYVAGEDEASDKFVIFCYGLNGSPDLSFGNGGMSAALETSSEPTGLTILTNRGTPTGILAAGTVNDAIAIAKYSMNGSLDTSFGNGGKIVTPIGTDDAFAADVAFSGGQIVVAGIVYTPLAEDALTLRYHFDGSLDTSFDGDGIRIDNVGGRFSSARAIVKQPDGKIVVAGSMRSAAGNDDFALLRCNPDGTLDPTFGVAGFVTTPISAESDLVRGLAIQPDGRILAVGETGDSPDQALALARYNANGSLDPSFGAGGIVINSTGTFSRIGYAVAVRADGKILAAATAEFFGGTLNLAVLFFSANGTLEKTALTRFGNFAAAGYALALQPDGKAIAAGTTWTMTTQSFACVRLLPDGTFDPSFDGDGHVVTTIHGFADQANAVVVTDDGRILLAGSGHDGTSPTIALVRYHPDGSLDTTFDGDGRVTHHLASGYVEGSALTLQPNGKILVAGTASIGSQSDLAFMRLQDDGTRDLSYGDAGFVLHDLDFGSYDLGYAMVMDSAGRAIVAGIIGPFASVVRVLGDEPTSDTLGDLEARAGMRLGDPWPNPARGQTAIAFHLDTPGPLKIAIYDVRGRLVRALVEKDRFGPGNHTITWDGRDVAGAQVASGVYILSAHRNRATQVRRITVLR